MAQKMDALSYTGRCRGILQRGRIRTVAYDDKMRIRSPAGGQGVDQLQSALTRDQPSDRDHDECVRRDTELLTWSARDGRRSFDAKRNELDRALNAVDLGNMPHGVAGLADDFICGVQHVADRRTQP